MSPSSPEPHRLPDTAEGGCATRPLKILVTAGPTREPLDPVRFLSNRSSGKMGTALAAVAAAAGHEVTLIAGPTDLPTPPRVRRMDVTTAAEMAAAVKREFPACDALLMTAAVADYRPRAVAAQKIKKGRGTLVLELERTEDILSSVAAIKRPGQRVMGFAAETERLADHAREKLARKRLDWIVANDVSRADIGFGSDLNEVTVFSPDGELPLPRMSKADLAARLLEIVAASFPARRQ
jgi:phosphopantothenoylcysteine decarboxylase / phosphopantothenate---cysteine ligase